MSLFKRTDKDADLISALNRSGQVQFKAEAKARIKQSVLQAFEAVTARGIDRSYKQPTRLIINFNRMIPVIIAIVVLVTGVGTAVASDSAKPGDWLFPVDRAVESARLTLTLRDTDRAKLSAKIAEEREQERLELKAENQTNQAEEADEHTNRALDNAIETVDGVLAKQIEKGNDGAVQALTNVSLKLRAIQDRHEAEDAGLTEAEAKIINGRTKIELEFNDQHMTYWIDATDEASIIASIKTKTNVTEEQIKAVLKIESEDNPDENENENDNSNSTPPGNNNVNQGESDDEEDSDDTNSNANGSLNANRSNNEESDDDSENNNGHQTARWQIEVRVENSQATVETRSGSVEQTWVIGSADRDSILADIATRTGLTVAEIESIWSYEAED